MPKRTYELVLVIEADSVRAGLRAADEAWKAVDRQAGTSIRASLAQERRADGTLSDPHWPGWDEEADIAIALRYFEE